MRIFIAMPFSETVTELLEKAQNDIKRAGARGNFTPRQNLHLTLAFIGEISDTRPIISALESVDFPRAELSFEKFCMFGDILVAKLCKNDALSEYAEKLRRALANVGATYDRKPFFAHTTLIRHASFPTQTFDISAYFEPLKEIREKPRKICVFRSDFTDGKPKYTAIHTKIPI